MAKINTPNAANAQEDAYAGRTREDPFDYDPATQYYQNIYQPKFNDIEWMNEILALHKSRVASKAYRQTFACIAGLNVGDPVYNSANNTATLADATTAAKSKIFGFCRYKPTTTTCFIDHFRYISGLAGLTAGNDVYLSNAGGVAAAPGTITRVIGIAISATEALLFASPISASTQNNSGLILGPEVDLKALATTQLPIPCSTFNPDEVGLRLTTVGGTITAQPTVRWGINGNNAKYKGAIQTTLLTAVGKRERFANLAVDDGETAAGTAFLTFEVTVVAAGSSTIKGVPYFRGLPS